MKLVFDGLEEPVYIARNSVSVMEVHNRALFARIVHSLACTDCVRSGEEFSLWDGEGKELAPKNGFLYIADPFRLPWGERDLEGALYRRLEEILFEDYELRERIELLHGSMLSQVGLLGFQLSADYRFEVEWELRRYLKAFGYSVEKRSGSLFDNLIKFVTFASDMGFSRVMLFVNLKTFLTENELEAFYGQAVFSGISMLLLENAADDRVFEKESKRVIDQHFLEY